MHTSTSRRTQTVTSATLLSAILFLCVSAGAGAQASRPPSPMKEDAPGLLAKAHVTPDSARALARARVPAAEIAEEGIEMEHGKLVYSFDMKTRGRRGIDEVVIDAVSGAIISVEHEGPAQEAAERAQDERERRAKRDSTRKP
jgi:Peptidase propeptide and YPEB domain